MNWREYLHARLREIQPDSLCALDTAAHQLARDALQNTPITLHGESPAQVCTIALGIDALKGLDAQHAEHLISQTRLYVSPRVLLVAHKNCALDESAFRALGFTLSASDPANHTHVYYYDLDAYKAVPDWLNSRYWAHPERWEP